MHLLHFHFESVLRILRIAQPNALKRVQRIFGTQSYATGSPAARLGFLEDCVSDLAREYASLFTAQNFQQAVKQFVQDMQAQGVTHVDLRIGVTPHISGVQTFDDVGRIFAAEMQAYPPLSVSFLAAVNMRKSTAALDAIFEKVSADAAGQNQITGLDINLLPADLQKFKQYVPELRALQTRGKKINLHLGELFSNDFSRQLLSYITPNRIGHGVLLLSDQELVSFIRKNNICLDMCPVSNTALGVIDWVHHNPARTALLFGLPVSISTDDPLLFDTTLQRELQLAALTPAEQATITRNAERYSYRP